MTTSILNAKSYYTLEYSLIMDNKILQVKGNVENNELDGSISLVNESVQELYSEINGRTLTLPIGFENNEDVQISNWYNVYNYYYKNINSENPEKYDAGFGRTEYLKTTKVFTVTANKPIKLSKIDVSVTGKGYKKQEKSDIGSNEDNISNYMRYENIIKNFPLTSNEDKFVLFNDSNDTYFNKDDTNALITDIDSFYPPATIPFMKSYNLSSPEIIDDNHYRYIISAKVSPDTFCIMQGIISKTSNQKDVSKDSLIVDVQRLSDYAYRISIDFVPKFNSVATSRYVDDGGNFKNLQSSIIYNVVDKFDVSIDAFTVNGESLEYEFHSDVKDYEKYKTTISSNELITNMLTNGEMQWKEYISHTLLDKFKDGKFWIKAKVKNKFMNDNNIHINSKIQIKDVDGDYISRGIVPCTFLVKNIETVYEGSQCYNNIILMEV